MRLKTLLGGLAITTLLSFAARAEPHYVVFDIPGSSGQTYATAINDKGDVAGQNTAGGAFIRHADGSFATFSISRSNAMVPTSINKKGEVVGYYFAKNYGVTRAFLRRSDGTIATFRVPHDGAQNRPATVTATGTIIGFTYSPDGQKNSHGYIRDRNGQVTDIGCHCSVAGGNNFGAVTGSAGADGFVRNPDGSIATFSAGVVTRPSAINAVSTVTGNFVDSNDGTVKGFVRSADGTIASFQVDQHGPDGRGDPATVPVAINSHGTVAGNYAPPDGSHGFVRDRRGRIAVFDPPDSRFTVVAGITAKGVIVGSFFSQTTQGYSGFLRVP